MYLLNFQEQFTQTENLRSFQNQFSQTQNSNQDKCIQTDIFIGSSNRDKTSCFEFSFSMLSILVHVLRSIFSDWNSISERVLSTLIYMILRNCSITWREIEKIFCLLDCLNIKHAHRWASTLAESHDASIILNDKRGGYRTNQLYIDYPELEMEAKNFAIQETKKRNCLFSVNELAKYLTKKYEELSGETLPDGSFIRSDSSLRLDLIRWGAQWDDNNKRPYFEGHERDDVTEYRKEFVHFFVQNKNKIYQQTSDDKCEWIDPSDDPPYIAISHFWFSTSMLIYLAYRNMNGNKL